MDNFKNLLREIDELPELPDIAFKILQKIDDVNISNKELAKFIEASPALTLKILRIINSPFYGLPNKVTSISQAIGLLGRKTLRNIAMTIFILKKIIDKFKDEYIAWENLIYSLIIVRYLSKIEKLNEEIIILDILINVPILLAVYLKINSFKIIKEMYFSNDYVEVINNYIKALKEKWNIDENLLEALKDYHYFCLGKKIERKDIKILYCSNKIANFLSINGEDITRIIKETKEIIPYFSINEEFFENINREANEIFQIFEIPFDKRYFNDIFIFFTKANKKISELIIENEKLIESLNNVNNLLSTALNNFPSGVIVFENDIVSLINIHAIELLDLNTKILDLSFNEFIEKFIGKDIFDQNPGFVRLNITLTNGHPVELTYLGHDYLFPRKIIFLKSIKKEQELRKRYSDLKETYINILKCIADSIVITDLDLIISFANEKFYMLIDEKLNILEKPVGKNLFDILQIKKSDRINFKKKLDKLILNKISEFRFEITNRMNLIFELTVTKFIHSGSLNGFQFIIREITEEKKIKEEMMKNKITVELAGATAHDLNQPLTTLTLTLDILKEISKDEKNIKYLEKMENSVNRISEIVKKLSKITRYETRSYFGDERIISLDDD